MIKDNLRIYSLDVSLALRITENFIFPDKTNDIPSWIALFRKLSSTTTDADRLRLYNAYAKLFKIAKSKAKLTSVNALTNYELVFTFKFRNLSNYSFFVKQIDNFTDNR